MASNLEIGHNKNVANLSNSKITNQRSKNIQNKT